MLSEEDPYLTIQSSQDPSFQKTKRKYFTKKHEVIPLPNLIEIQQNSYRWFLEEGLKELLEQISPIEDFTGENLALKFTGHLLDEPKLDELQTKFRNATYEAAIRAQVELINKKTQEIKEQEIYLGDIPLMTDRGTFIINGIERVIVSQLIRSPGVFYTMETKGGQKLFGAKVIPDRGAWLEFETDSLGAIHVRIDRKRKVAATTLLRAFGYSQDEQIKDLFRDTDTKDLKYTKATIAKDPSKNQAEGFIEVYKRIRPGDLATADNARSLIEAMFFNFERYDLGKVGRYKLNQRLGLEVPIKKGTRILRPEDLVDILRELIRLNSSQGEPDDIDHLGSRCVRTVGELLQARTRVGLMRTERIVKDRMSILDIETVTPTQLINTRPIVSAVREFFMSSQLSQFMDQTNPLSELEHKRRLSVMGPGGLSRERAGFEVRDVHSSHYGRICPIATPEGPNIGLVGHLASYARINEYGFIETPYRKVIHDIKKENLDKVKGEITREDVKDRKGRIIIREGVKISKQDIERIKKSDIDSIPLKPRVTNEIVYLDAYEDEKVINTPATTAIDENGYFKEARAEVRIGGIPATETVNKIDYMDVAPNQIISIATSLIPFLEHDDANRALMGTNMQRQAVVSIRPEAPIIGTGMETRSALDSGSVTLARKAGKVKEVDANHIIILEEDGNTKTYNLSKFVRSNTNTCINQRPAVDLQDKVTKNQVIADGAATQDGELALGQNLLCAFMSWEGGNFEDAVLISDRVLHEDRFTTIHIEDFSCDVRDTKLGPEMVTRDIPNVSEEKLKNLDEEGIVRVGAEVRQGDILVGKITPKGETELTAEERLLRALFGEEAKEVKDTSLYLQHGKRGKVVGIKIFSREKGDKLEAGVIKTIQVSIAQLRKVQVGDKLTGRHGNKGVISKIVPQEDMPCLADGTFVDIILNPLGVISRMNIGQILETHLSWAAQKLGYKVASPAFDGVPESIIKEELEKAGLPQNGKVTLYDGKTGEPFHEKVTCGYMYVLKLAHLVEDKIHQRSIGPYSLITQQPLGGKAQFGGQRFGEMEVWALEAYGAAHTLQEILTIKSDDVPGRAKTYEAIIKGEPIRKPHVPESFSVLVRELKSLGLDVELQNKEQQIDKSKKPNTRA